MKDLSKTIADIGRSLELINASLGSAEHDAREVNKRLHAAKNDLDHATHKLLEIWKRIEEDTDQ